jgi:hypothetical protein
MDLDLSHWWLAKLVVAQTLYLFGVLWGMRYLHRRLARIRGHRSGLRHPARTAAGGFPVPVPKR